MRHLRFIIPCLFLLSAYRMIAQNPPPPCGTPGVPDTYVDTLNGVIAYSNDHGGPSGCYDPNAFKWECVEFIERYYWERFHVRLGSIPTAAQAFGILHDNSQFLTFAQESTVIPQAEDIIVFGTNASTPFGHVAIVKTNPILQSDGSYQIQIIEQNSYLKHVLVMQGNAIVGFTIVGRLMPQNTAPIIGWIRRASSSPSNPVPSISQLQPNSLLAGSAEQAITITGSEFLATSTVTFNGVAHSATYVNASQLTVSLTVADLATAGSYPVVVMNPAPGGGPSAAINFTVVANNPIPSITALSPASLEVGATPQTLSINGTGFLTSSTVTFNGGAHVATYVNASQLTISLNTADLDTAGDYPVIVSNPSPGGGSSAAASFSVTSNQNANEWTWMDGSSIANQSGIYGTLGVPATNTVPGARDSAVGWADKSGNLWLFGGEQGNGGGTPDFNDLWEFSPNTEQWTWISGSNTTGAAGVYGVLGVQSSSNVPPARGIGSSVWTDLDGNLWLFGGFGDSGDRNDLWRFSPTNKEWAWVSGSQTARANGVYGTKGTSSANNVPGARDSAVSWTDKSGNLWLFGGIARTSFGFGFDLNDLWTFNPKSNQWTWISGSNTPNASGVYGTKGVASSDNFPGARDSSVGWTDTAGNLWLFGGNSTVTYNDLWEFNIISKVWIWMGGTSDVNVSGKYGTRGIPSKNNIPGSREQASGWTDASGTFWLYGGEGMDAGNEMGILDDLWRFDPSTLEWTWMAGNKFVDQNDCYTFYDSGEVCAYPGVYGIQGSPAPSNHPGSRYSAVSWTGSNGDLWLFGGAGIDSGQSGGPLNDLWRFQP